MRRPEPTGERTSERREAAPAPSSRAPADVTAAQVLQRAAGNRAFTRLVHSAERPTADGPTLVQRAFSQQGPRNQESTHGGVKSQYDRDANLIELHIEANANNEGKLMEDFLAALWEARDALTAGEARTPPVPGTVFMRPGGAKVLKLTMELLGEALGHGADRDLARQLKGVRKAAQPMLGIGIPADRREDVVDSAFVGEHVAYRDSLVGVPGITMSPSGGGTSGATVDMLDASPANAAAAAAERRLYDEALLALRPFLSLHVTLTLAGLNQVITMLEGRAGRFRTLWLKARYLSSK